MPDKNRSTLLFDRKYLRQQIKYLNYTEARRVKGPVYEALEQELCEAGCTYSARQVRCLSRIEESLYSNSTIKQTLSSDTALLYALVENAKSAELSFHQVDCSGHVKSMSLLQKNLQLLEPLRVQYDWLLRRLYEITLKIGHSVQGQLDCTDQVIADVYYKFACYLSVKVVDWDQAVRVLYMAVPLVRGKNWTVRVEHTNETQTMHEAVCRKLGQLLIKLGKSQVLKDSARAIQLAQSSVQAIAEVGMTSNRALTCRGYLTLGIALYENGQLHRALKELHKVKLYDKSNPCVKDERKVLGKIRCRTHLYIGACYLNLDEDSQVPQHLYAALMLAQQYGWPRCEAETHLLLGKMYSKRGTETGLIAKESYEAAKAIYVAMGDMNNCKKTTYLLAKLKADELFPQFLELMRGSTFQPCVMHKLRVWKNRCRPFWPRASAPDIDETDPLYCLLNAEKEPQDLVKRKWHLFKTLTDVPKYLMVIKMFQGH